MVKKKEVKKKLYRASKERSIIAGVCAGIADYLEVDPTVIRLLWIIGTLIYGAGLLAYILAWIIIPRK